MPALHLSQTAPYHRPDSFVHGCPSESLLGGTARSHDDLGATARSQMSLDRLLDLTHRGGGGASFLELLLDTARSGRHASSHGAVGHPGGLPPVSSADSSLVLDSPRSGAMTLEPFSSRTLVSRASGGVHADDASSIATLSETLRSERGGGRSARSMMSPGGREAGSVVSDMDALHSERLRPASVMSYPVEERPEVSPHEMSVVTSRPPLRDEGVAAARPAEGDDASDASLEMTQETQSIMGLGDSRGSSSNGGRSILHTTLGDTNSFEGLGTMLQRLAVDGSGLDESLARSVRRVLQLGTVLTGQRLSDDEIRALPKVRFEDAEQQRCAICLEAYQRGELLTALRCSHFFHVECLSSWFRRATQCPLCRADAGEGGP